MKSLKELAASVDRGCLVIAHRGDWQNAPENSCAAVTSAIEIGADLVEIDIRRSRDGGLVVLHDDDTQRMTGQCLVPEQTDQAALRALALYAGDGSGRLPSDQHVASLAEVLETGRGRIRFDLDLKDRSLAPEVAREVARLGMTDQVDVKFAAQDRAGFIRIRDFQEATGIATMAITDFSQGADDLLAELLGCPPFMVETRFADLTALAAICKRLAQADVAVWVNTINVSHSLDFNDDNALLSPDRVWGALLGAGVRAIQTDQSAALGAWLRQEGFK